MRQNYFDYGSKIESKRLAEAIAMPAGVGPICGFGSATLSNNKITLYSYGRGDDASANSNESPADPLRFLIRSRVDTRYIPTAQDASAGESTITFGVIARDGILYRSGEYSFDVNIENPNDNHTFNQVFVFACHRYITESVTNLVEFKAFYNTSSINDFYTLYQKSLDIYHLSGTNRKESIADVNDPFLNREFTYDGLIRKVRDSCPQYRDNEKEMVLVGIYGFDTNPDQNGKNFENFAIVPYNGNFPGDIPYNTALHSYFKSAISRIERYINYDKLDNVKDDKGVTPVDENGNPKVKDIPSYIEWLVEQKTASLSKQIELAALPVGSIILWPSDQVPEGWHEYIIAAGRVVIGYRAGGVEVDNTTGGGTSMILTKLEDTYNPLNEKGSYTIKINADDLPKHYHGIGLIPGRQDNAKDVYSVCVGNFSERKVDINGDFWDSGYNPVHNIKQGAVLSGANIIGNSNPTNETTVNQAIFDKLPPAITLMYIQKEAPKV